MMALVVSDLPFLFIKSYLLFCLLGLVERKDRNTVFIIAHFFQVHLGSSMAPTSPMMILYTQSFLRTRILRRLN
jgi:hypothetical protein